MRDAAGTAGRPTGVVPCPREGLSRGGASSRRRARRPPVGRTRTTDVPAFFSGSCSACCASSSARRSSVMTNTRPSLFFVVPASRRTSLVLKLTCRHSNGSTSLAMRQPVMYVKVTIAESLRAGAPARIETGPARRTPSACCSRPVGECAVCGAASRPASRGLNIRLSVVSSRLISAFETGRRTSGSCCQRPPGNCQRRAAKGLGGSCGTRVLVGPSLCYSWPLSAGTRGDI